IRESLGTSPAAQVLLYGACAVLVAAGLQAAAALVNALVLAIVLATVLRPPVRRLQAAGLPGWVAVLVVLGPVAVLGILVVTFLVHSLHELDAKVPEYVTRIAALATRVSERVL